MNIECRECGRTFESAGRRGRSPLFCGATCRKRASRRRGRARDRFMELARGRWVRARGKRPVMVDGRAASSTDPSTWASHTAVVTSSAGDGLGVMLGGGLACLDLDDCFEGGRLTAWAKAAIEALDGPVLLMERSVSGRGLHVFHEAPEGPGRSRGGVEHFSRDRFIKCTFDTNLPPDVAGLWRYPNMRDSTPVFHKGKSCKECSSGIPVSENARSAYCSQECRAEGVRRRGREHARKKAADRLLTPLTCAWCSTEFHRATSGPGRGRFKKYCSEKCSRASAAGKAAEYRTTDEWKDWYRARVESGHYKEKGRLRREANPSPVHVGECIYCGGDTRWVGNQRRRTVCSSQVCRGKYATDCGHMRRARIRDTSVEFVSRFEVFERDGWVCQLCLEPIDESLKWPDPGSPVIDHILPISRGGAHVKDNLQAAHARCNSVKSNKTEDELSG